MNQTSCATCAVLFINEFVCFGPNLSFSAPKGFGRQLADDRRWTDRRWWRSVELSQRRRQWQSHRPVAKAAHSRRVLPADLRPGGGFAKWGGGGGLIGPILLPCICHCPMCQSYCLGDMLPARAWGRAWAWTACACGASRRTRTRTGRTWTPAHHHKH